MGTVRKIIAVFILLAATCSCLDEYTEEITANTPVYMGYEEFRNAITQTGAVSLKNPGKIYFKDNYIFINEELQGIHVINNADPAHPQNAAFIEIPGNIDMAIKDNILFADSYIDLVAIDISGLNNIQEISRVEGVFPYTVPPYDENYAVAEVDETKGVVVDWTLKGYRHKMEQQTKYWVYSYNRGEYGLDLASGFSSSSGNGSAGTSFGIGGSMARFGLYDDYLYAVTENDMFVFDADDATSVNKISSQSIGSDVETMFIYDSHMFLGTRSSMLVYSLENTTAPVFKGTFSHATSCDPVVVSDGYAYITLHDGTRCGNDVNRLDIVKLSDDYMANTHVASYDMYNPYGLGIDDQTLFICDGDEGLKVYDVTDKLHVDDHQIASFPNINTYDVIPVNGYLFMIGDNGFYQYDYSDLQNIFQVSVIPVANED